MFLEVEYTMVIQVKDFILLSLGAVWCGTVIYNALLFKPSSIKNSQHAPSEMTSVSIGVKSLSLEITCYL